MLKWSNLEQLKKSQNTFYNKKIFGLTKISEFFYICSTSP